MRDLLWGTTKVSPESPLGQEVGKFIGYCHEARSMKQVQTSVLYNGFDALFGTRRSVLPIVINRIYHNIAPCPNFMSTGSYLVHEQIWLVMEYMDGGTLYDVIRKTHISEDDIELSVGRVLYHQEEEMYRFLEETIQLHKREVITGVTIAMLLGLGSAGTATGVSALVTQHRGLSQLQMTIDEDLLRTEKSISSLEESISSLSEVILQNRRGLDLLLMQQEDLCAALREECCFYADHTGVV
ncbi:hypothetical protein DUI87_12654 [Hirundo rustica rustica]|uniref:Protein kinase domain-containing protein n=1 Tax=Hirundo rustica rustica TaxID=333673 RepID=A0A3M0KEG5_HIRRU|nr:hypothetical protein DUI87_12654 [Hirundo rustica rustica]